MRTPITLEEFLFTLNQDEDLLLTIIDYENDDTIFHGWKSDFTIFDSKYDNWFIENFIIINGCLEVTIVESKEELF